MNPELQLLGRNIDTTSAHSTSLLLSEQIKKYFISAHNYYLFLSIIRSKLEFCNAQQKKLTFSIVFTIRSCNSASNIKNIYKLLVSTKGVKHIEATAINCFVFKCSLLFNTVAALHFRPQTLSPSLDTTF
jgi:hypothetical protein